jgi:hypothetical protein
MFVVGFDVKSGLLINEFLPSQVLPLAGCDVSRPNKLSFASTVLMIGSLARLVWSGLPRRRKPVRALRISIIDRSGAQL